MVPNDFTGSPPEVGTPLVRTTGLATVPPQFATREFFELARSRLSSRGVFIANHAGSLAPRTAPMLLSLYKIFFSPLATGAGLCHAGAGWLGWTHADLVRAGWLLARFAPNLMNRMAIGFVARARAAQSAARDGGPA